MDYIRGAVFSLQNTCVAFGSFDGMHVGHAAVVRRLREFAPLQPAVLSLETTGQPLVYNEAEKRRLLRQWGVTTFVSFPAAVAAAMDARDFVREIIVGRMGARVIVCGTESPYYGVLLALADACGYRLVTEPPVPVRGEPVSLSRLVGAMENDDFAAMCELEGHPHLIAGTVVHGKGQGRKFGMPTANIAVSPDKRFPPHGVYASIAYVKNGVWQSMTNIGLRPSDDNIPIPTIEAHLFDFDEDIYDQPFSLELHQYIRPVMKFPSIREVRERVYRDKELIRDYLDHLAADAARELP